MVLNSNKSSFAETDSRPRRVRPSPPEAAVVCPIDPAKRQDLLNKGARKSLQPSSVAVSPGNELKPAGRGRRLQDRYGRPPAPYHRGDCGDTHVPRR